MLVPAGPAVNFVPGLPLGGENPDGRHAEGGRRFELVALPDGGAFDLLGMSG